MATPDEVRSEHALLAELRGADLPSAVPEPVPAADGSTVALARTDRGMRPAALYERLDGAHPDDEDLDAIEAAGAAFAHLDRALASVRAPRDAADPRLDRIHPLVSDLDDLHQLGEGARFVRAMAGHPAILRASLAPRQLIHQVPRRHRGRDLPRRSCRSGDPPRGVDGSPGGLGHRRLS